MVYILGILDLRGGSAYGSAKAVGRISSRIVVRLLWAAQHFQCYEVIQYVIHPMVLLPRTKITGAKMGRISHPAFAHALFSWRQDFERCHEGPTPFPLRNSLSIRWKVSLNIAMYDGAL
jgi:hypothetical protein